MGIDRERIVKNFYPAGSTVADYFTPCEIPFACEGDKTWDFDADAAKQLLAEAGFPDGIDRPQSQFRAAVRGYLPDPPAIATEIASSSRPTSASTPPWTSRSPATFLDGVAAGTLDGICMLGWGADYPDPSNFLDYHFGSGSGKKFGEPFHDIVAALNTGVRRPIRPPARPPTPRPTT